MLGCNLLILLELLSSLVWLHQVLVKHYIDYLEYLEYLWLVQSNYGDIPAPGQRNYSEGAFCPHVPLLVARHLILLLMTL